MRDTQQRPGQSSLEWPELGKAARVEGMEVQFLISGPANIVRRGHNTVVCVWGGVRV